MSMRGVADVVFCIDVSTSMEPCIAGVKDNIGAFLDGLTSSRQEAWDLRFDYAAHCAGEGAGFPQWSLFNDALIPALYWPHVGGGRYFTTDVAELRRGLGRLGCVGDEAPLVGLDSALDFPWRERCHRVVVMLTDEPFESGIFQEPQLAVLDALIEKMQALRVMLFLVAPASPTYETLAEADRCEWIEIDKVGDGLASVDFRKVLSHIGKSVSASNANQGPAKTVQRGIFGQATWIEGTNPVTKEDRK